jgi:O-antigen ligase
MNMTLSLEATFALQVCTIVIVYLLFVDKQQIPIPLQIITGASFVTSPAVVLERGAQSAIYVTDIVIPLVVIICARHMRIDEIIHDGRVRAFLVLLLGVPLLAGTLGFVLGGGDISLLSRSMNATVLWLYRNTCGVLVFMLVLSMRLTGSQVIAWIRMNLVLVSVVAGAGVVTYLTPIDLAAFERIMPEVDPERLHHIDETRIGAGFLGLFRGSVGQWFGIQVVLFLGLLPVLERRHWPWALVGIVLSVAVVLMSYSRAGVIGMAVGILALSVFGKGLYQRSYGVLGAALVVIIAFTQLDVIGDRLESIFTHGDRASAGRIIAWERSLNVFATELETFAVGVGPTNRQAVFKLIGAYGAHNEYIDAIFRMGVLGPIAILMVLYKLVSSYWKLRRSREADVRYLGSTMVAVIIANAAIGLTQANLLHDYSGYTCWLFMYLLYGVTTSTTLSTMPVVSQPQTDASGELNRFGQTV